MDDGSIRSGGDTYRKKLHLKKRLIIADKVEFVLPEKVHTSNLIKHVVYYTVL